MLLVKFSVQIMVLHVYGTKKVVPLTFIVGIERKVSLTVSVHSAYGVGPRFLMSQNGSGAGTLPYGLLA